YVVDGDNSVSDPLNRTPLALTNNISHNTTYYFRKLIPAVHAACLSSVLITNLVDDGAVFYLNGTELFRYNLPEPPTTISYSTFASSSVEASLQVTNIAVNMQGSDPMDVYFAVEVHNANNTSSDIVFAASLDATFRPPIPVAITNQPKSVTAPVGSSVSFTSGFAGDLVKVQWLKDGEALVGRTATVLTIPQCAGTDIGQYVMQASNVFGIVTSQPAALTVVPIAGEPLIALQPRSTSALLGSSVSFTSAVVGDAVTLQWLKNGVRLPAQNATVLNLLNCTFGDAGQYLLQASNLHGIAQTQPAALTVTNTVPIITNQPQSALASVGSSISFTCRVAGAGLALHWLKDGLDLPNRTSSILIISNCALTDAGHYFLQASNIYGVVTSEPATLTVVSTNGVPVALVEFASTWNFLASGADPGPSWKQPNFDDSSWERGRGLFAANFNGYPEPINTSLPLTNSSGVRVITRYFRIHFDYSLPTTNINISFSNLLDGGAVYYLNGSEVNRANMNYGSVSNSTFSYGSSSHGGVFETVPWPFFPRPGDNVLAVEVHQTDFPFAPSVAFDGSFTVSAKIPVPLQVLTEPSDIETNEFESIQLKFGLFGSGPFQSQWFKDTLLLPGATNLSLVLTNVHGLDSGAYHCVAWSPLNSVTSLTAQVTILQDTMPPALLSAVAYGASSVLLSFSEALDPASITNLFNYSTSPLLPLKAAQRVGSNAVVLTFGQRAPDSLMIKVTGGVRDLAIPPNTIAGPVSAPVTFVDREAFENPMTAIKTAFVILFENHSWKKILGSTNAPYFNSLLVNASYASQYYSPYDLHPSLPNYLWLLAGTNFGVLDDGGPDYHHFATHANLPYLLDRAGVPWKSYQEDISGTNCPTFSSYNYTVHHNPAMYFDDLTVDFDYCTNHMRPFRELATDLSANNVSGFLFITPNLTNDMHSGPPGVSTIKIGDNWLAANLPGILESSAYRDNGAVFITWDENDSLAHEPIGMIVLSPLAKGGGYVSTNYYNHASALRTFQEIFGVRPFLGESTARQGLGELFKLLSISSLSWSTEGASLLTVTNCLPGKTNVLEASPDLIAWETIGLNVSSTNFFQAQVPQAIPFRSRFYRVRQLP
ncbi:MAG: putative acid phosphatase, partial [Verrucomicrobiales bacterium]|nr:putative acid phosphatase [Verrucomicrobiales bacterium]